MVTDVTTVLVAKVISMLVVRVRSAFVIIVISVLVVKNVSTFETTLNQRVFHASIVPLHSGSLGFHRLETVKNPFVTPSRKSAKPALMDEPLLPSN